MTNNSTKTNKKDAEKTFLVKKTAEMHNVSTDYVYKITSGERDHEEIFTTYMDLRTGVNELVEAVRKLIPFN